MLIGFEAGVVHTVVNANIFWLANKTTSAGSYLIPLSAPSYLLLLFCREHVLSQRITKLEMERFKKRVQQQDSKFKGKEEDIDS